jgi:glycosyltransferase involved in cell wall biosynthesis
VPHAVNARALRYTRDDATARPENMALVTIVLPTYNRARFLPDAFASIAAQTHRDWELVLVDDGSVDDTPDVVAQLTRSLGQKVVVVRTDNHGAYAARNVGLHHASGEYIAFYDSDDLWLPHHLEHCLQGLEASQVDWVYAACRSVDTTGKILAPSTFEHDGDQRPFLRLRQRVVGALHVIEDDGALECQLTHGLYAGLQNSVIRRRVFDSDRFWEDYRVVEDSLFLIRAMSRGLRIGYLTDVHVVYRVHDGNSSASADGASAERLLPIFEEHVRGLERIRRETALSPRASRALRHNLGLLYFWRVGYSGHWQLAHVDEAFRAFKTGLLMRPFDLRMWATYASCVAKAWTRGNAAGTAKPNRD